MRSCHKCEQCGEDITAGLFSGLAHLKCKQCGSSYQLDQHSMKIYIFLPLLSVAAAVGCSIRFLQDTTIDIKTIFILGMSFAIVNILGRICIKAKLLVYEKKQQ